MSGILQSVTTGKQIGAQIHTIIGHNGVGKTTWGASFPGAIVVDLENGSNHIDVARVGADKVPTLEAFRGLLKELAEVDHAYKAVVIDSVEALEGLISDGVCAENKVTSIEDVGGGYGKGFTRTREIMREIFVDLRRLQVKGITTILVAHTQVKTHADPILNQSYDRVIMRCNDKMAAIVRDLSDNVFYATYKVFATLEKGSKKAKAFGDGQRVMYTSWRAGFDAKNRLELPHELPLSYEAFAEACNRAPSLDATEITEEIKAMSEKLDPGLKKDVDAMLAKFKDNPSKLKEVKNRLMKYAAA